LGKRESVKATINRKQPPGGANRGDGLPLHLSNTKQGGEGAANSKDRGHFSLPG